MNLSNRAMALTAFAATVSVLSVSGPAQAAIVNGGFDAGLSNWDTSGVVNIVAPGGNNAAELNTGAETASALEAFLGLAPGSLTDLANQTNSLFSGPHNLFSGSAIKQSFTAGAGDIVNFTYNFTTSESPGFFNDFGFTTLRSSVNGLASVKSVFSDFGINTTGPQTFSWVIPAAGTYTLGLGVINVGDNSVGSTLVVDDASLTAVPTPALLPGLIGMGLGVWRKRKGSVAESQA